MNKVIRVAHVLAGAANGGAEKFYTRLLTGLSAYPQLEQKAFTRSNEKREKDLTLANITLQTFRFGGPLHFYNNRKYSQSLQNWQPDIVLTYMNRATKLTPQGDYQLVARLGHFYDLKYYRHCDYWIGNTKGICEHIINGGMKADRVVHIPNFVDETIAQAIPKNSFATPEGVPVLLALGRLHTNKAFDILIRALSKVADAYLWLAGEGPELSNLHKLCKELNLTERVRFLGWRDDVNSLMKTADIFVCPSRHEGLGSIVLEAWFNHCPIVATSSQGPAELIEDGVSGLLSPIDEIEPLADAINSLIQNPDRAEKMADNGQNKYLKYYSREKITRQYVDFFQSII